MTDRTSPTFRCVHLLQRVRFFLLSMSPRLGCSTASKTLLIRRDWSHPLITLRALSLTGEPCSWDTLYSSACCFTGMDNLTRTCTSWCSEISSLTSLDACNSGSFCDVRESISLHEAVVWEWVCVENAILIFRAVVLLCMNLKRSFNCFCVGIFCLPIPGLTHVCYWGLKATHFVNVGYSIWQVECYLRCPVLLLFFPAGFAGLVWRQTVTTVKRFQLVFLEKILQGGVRMSQRRTGHLAPRHTATVSMQMTIIILRCNCLEYGSRAKQRRITPLLHRKCHSVARRLPEIIMRRNTGCVGLRWWLFHGLRKKQPERFTGLPVIHSC